MWLIPQIPRPPDTRLGVLFLNSGMKILLADDQPRVRFALRILLEQQPGWVVVGEAKDSAEMLAHARLREPDLVLLDDDLPGGTLAWRLNAVRAICPTVCVIVLGEERPNHDAHPAPNAFASKANPPEHLLKVIHACTNERPNRQGALRR
jgi:DNA-binding NarL/FixJ family response regulator